MKCYLEIRLVSAVTYSVLQAGVNNSTKSAARKRALEANSTWRVQDLRSPKEAFATAMQSWRERCEKCVCLHGDYVEK